MDLHTVNKSQTPRTIEGVNAVDTFIPIGINARNLRFLVRFFINQIDALEG
ncbi:hypothetical protein PQR75_46610 [Paraburkholderia fungorum]|uniref:hypothetical protein n=1 Tax=Paraburkholderia fungorum TaxID=134537 RepID=UPI0038BDC648